MSKNKQKKLTSEDLAYQVLVELAKLKDDDKDKKGVWGKEVDIVCGKEQPSTDDPTLESLEFNINIKLLFITLKNGFKDIKLANEENKQTLITDLAQALNEKIKTTESDPYKFDAEEINIEINDFIKVKEKEKDTVDTINNDDELDQPLIPLEEEQNNIQKPAIVDKGEIKQKSSFNEIELATELANSILEEMATQFGDYAEQQKNFEALRNTSTGYRTKIEKQVDKFINEGKDIKNSSTK